MLNYQRVKHPEVADRSGKMTGEFGAVFRMLWWGTDFCGGRKMSGGVPGAKLTEMVAKYPHSSGHYPLWQLLDPGTPFPSSGHTKKLHWSCHTNITGNLRPAYDIQKCQIIYSSKPTRLQATSP